MADEDRFAELLSLVAREVTLRQASEVCCGDLTLEQFQTLAAVDKAEHSSIGSLSMKLRVDLSTMSRNVTLLEHNNYLARARNAEDGRIVHVRLTAKGRRALKTLRCGERDVLRGVFDRLSPAERPRTLKVLESLRSCLCQPGLQESSCCLPATVRTSSS